MLALQYVIIIISIICLGSILIYLALLYFLIDSGSFFDRKEELEKTRLYKRIHHIPAILVCFSFIAGPMYANNQEALEINTHKKIAIGTVSKVSTGKRSSISLSFMDLNDIERTTYIPLDDEEVDLISIGQLFTVEYSFENPEFSRVILEKPILPQSNSYSKRNATILEISENDGHLSIFYKFIYQLAPYYGIRFAPINTKLKEGDEFVYEFPDNDTYLGVLDLNKKLKKGEVIEKDSRRLSDDEVIKLLDSFEQTKKLNKP